MTTTLVSQTALRDEDFIQSIGVTTHLTATTSAYGNVAQIATELQYLNVTHVRDRVISTVFQAPFVTLGKDGIKFDLIAQAGDPALTLVALDALAPYLNSVEGPNEVDRSPITYRGVTGPSAAVTFQADLYAAVHSDPLLNGNGHSTPVLNFSLAPGADYTAYGNDSADADYKNVHAYGQYGCPSHWYLGPGISRAVDTPNLPAIVTETGNYTMLNNDSGVSEVVQAKLIMDTLLDDFQSGVVTTYIYQLADILSDPGNTTAEDHYGLFHFDGTPKVAATAIHNLTTILQDSATTAQSFTPAPLSYAVTNLNSSAFQFVMEKSSGAYDIALWWEPWIWNKATNTEVTFPTDYVTVTLGQVYSTIEVFDPLSGTTPIATYHNVSAVTVALGTGPLIVEVEPQSATTVAGGGKVITTGSAGGVFTSTGADTVIAGSGAATINAGGADTIVGSTGSLAVLLTASGASITGGTGALVVTDSHGGNIIRGGTGGLSLTASADGDIVTTNGTGNTLLFSGAGSDTVIANGATSMSAPHANLTVSGNGDLSINGGLGSITLTGGSGSDYVFTQTGTKNLLTLGSGKASILSHGADTINAGSGADNVYAGGAALINGGTGALSVNGQGSAITVNGGTGAVHASAGLGGGYIRGGSSGHNVLSASAGNTTLVGGGDGDTLTDTSTTGSNTLVAGSGSETLTGGTGTDLFVLTQSSVAHGEVIKGFTASDHLHFVGFGSVQPITSQQIVGSNLQLTLADNAQVTLVGITSLGAGAIV